MCCTHFLLYELYKLVTINGILFISNYKFKYMILFGIIFGVLITLIIASCYIVAISFTVWMAIDAGKQDRFWWLVIIIGVPIIGPGAYYFTEKKHEYAKVSPHHIHNSETEEQHEKAPRRKIFRRPKVQIEEREEGSDIKKDTEVRQENLEENNNTEQKLE